MKEKIIKKIALKIGISHIADLLTRLSGSELNSLLLEVFSKRGQHTSPALLLQQYQANRFVHPADTDMIGLLTTELKILQLLRGRHFQPIELSPAAQWGSCSLLGPVDQKKIISATRNTEIMADATNTIALHIAGLRKSGKTQPPATAGEDTLRFCTVHRHIRAQELKEKRHTAHFKIGCLVTGGRDTGNCHFESTHLGEHMQALDDVFRNVFGITKIRFKLQKREGYKDIDGLLEKVAAYLRKNNAGLELTREDPPATNNYYKGIQYKMIIEVNEQEIEIADGGFVDWTQQLLDNKKERLLISGFGLGLLYKMQNTLV
jgi:hypothetical protein